MTPPVGPRFAVGGRNRPSVTQMEGLVCKPRRMPGRAEFVLPAVDVALLSRLAGALAAAIQPGDVVLLVGDLGAGKTTFTKHVAGALGVVESVTSPTFTIAHTYRAGPQAPVRSLMHLDAYRLGGAEDLDAVGLFDGLDEGAAAVIEWGDIVADAFDEPLTVDFAFVDEETRSVTCSAPPNSSWSGRIRSISAEMGGPRC